MSQNLSFPPIEPDQAFYLPPHVASIVAQLESHRRVFYVQPFITESGQWMLTATIYIGELPLLVWDGEADAIEISIQFRGDLLLCSIGDRSFKLKNANQIVLATLIESRKSPQSCNAA